MKTSTSRLATVVLAATLAMVASPAKALVLPPLPPLAPLLPLLVLPHLVTHLLRSLEPPIVVAPETWGDQEYYGPQPYARGDYLAPRYLRPAVPYRVAPRSWNNYESYGSQRTFRREERAPYPARRMAPPPRVAPRTWSNHGSFGAQRQTRGEDRRFAGPEKGRRNSTRYGERRDRGDSRRW